MGGKGEGEREEERGGEEKGDRQKGGRTYRRKRMISIRLSRIIVPNVLVGVEG